VPEPGRAQRNSTNVWPCLAVEGLALPRCSVLLLLTVLVPRRQLMSGGQYLPGVKGVCVACQQPANKICAFSSCSSPTCPSCSTMVMLPDEDRNLHYCVQHGVPAHHAIRVFMIDPKAMCGAFWLDLCQSVWCQSGACSNFCAAPPLPPRLSPDAIEQYCCFCRQHDQVFRISWNEDCIYHIQGLDPSASQTPSCRDSSLPAARILVWPRPRQKQE